MLSDTEAWLVCLSVLLPAAVFIIRGATDFQEPEQRTYRRSRPYGLVALAVCLLVVLSMLAGTIWEHLSAIENLDRVASNFFVPTCSGARDSRRAS